jgi:LysR family transcriptional regulator, nitrogen assimilation regulatory protein
MDFKQLKTFICVAETGSLSRASDRLRIAQPALSRQIKLLEHSVGVPLFDRHVRGMELTEAGSDLLRQVSGPLYQLEQSVAHVRSQGKRISGQVTLGVLPTVTPALAVHLLQRVGKELPGVTLHLKEAYSTSLLEWLQDGTVDAGFLYGPTEAYHLRTSALLTEDIVLLSPPGALPDQGDSISIHQLAGLPLALLNRPMGPRMVIDRIARDHGVELQSAYDVDSFPILVAMVKAGLCHTFMPASSVASERQSGHLFTRRILPQTPRRELILAQPSQRPTTRATDAVIILLKDVLAGMLASGELEARPGADLVLP